MVYVKLKDNSNGLGQTAVCHCLFCGRVGIANAGKGEVRKTVSDQIVSKCCEHTAP